MRTIRRTSLLVSFALLGMLACTLTGAPVAYQELDSTSVAQTIAAIIQATQHASTAPFVTGFATATTMATLTPTLTPTQIFTETPFFTVTPLSARISVSVPTNCRSGPGKVYEMVGALLVGETAQIYARDPTGSYWYIRNPDSSGEFCWVWGGYATITGYTAILPVYTPPPTPSPTFTSTPSPGFDASFDGLVSCSGSWWPEIDLDNTGSVTFKSVGIILKDTVTSVTASSLTDGFVDKTGCSSSNSKTSLLPGKTLTLSAPQLSYDPTGNKLRATITLCSSTGQNGTCVTETITFKP